MYRINIVGSSGSGKSTLAKALSKKLDIPHIEIDRLFWSGNWIEANEDDFRESLKQSLTSDNWVVDGNYNRTRDLKWERATHIIWIDYSFTRTLFQSLKRNTQRMFSNKPFWEGTECRETFARTYLNKDTSILWWMITNYNHNRKRYTKLLKNGNDYNVPMIHLQTPKQTKAFIENCKNILDKAKSQ